MSDILPVWEEIIRDDDTILERLVVPGGWLYRSVEYRAAEATVVTMCFVPSR